MAGFSSLRAILCAAIAAAAILTCAEPAFARRVALVIGNNDYRSVPVLSNPGNDASDVAAALQRLDFEVQQVKNGSFDDMRKGLLEFARRARGSEIAIVFYAGHGIEVGGQNYLIPIDAELKADVDVDHEAIALNNVTPLVENASRLGLVILDACRNNPFSAKMARTVRTRAVSRGLAAVEPTGNVLISFSAREGTTAADGAGRNSPFTTSLLKHLETPGLEINFLFRNVRDEVLRATKREQLPFVYGSLSSEAIYLKAALPVAPPPPVAKGPDLDEVAWGLMRDTRDLAQIERFISQFPQSPRRAEAQQRLSALQTERAASEAAARAKAEADARAAAAKGTEFEDVAWNLVREARDVSQLESFLSQFPRSPRRGEAEKRIAALKAERAAEAAARAKTEAVIKSASLAKGPDPDEVTWSLMRDTRDISQIERFISQFPQSARRPEAEKRIAALQSERAASDEAARAKAEADAKAAALSGMAELSRSLQLELKRVGCLDGGLSGDFGKPAQDALQKFAKFAAVSLAPGNEVSGDTLSVIRRFDRRVCPLNCRGDEKVEGDRCVRIVCPAGQTASKGSCVADPTRQAAPASERPAPGGSKCFTFNNRRFCE